jgi:hypothetical protein
VVWWPLHRSAEVSMLEQWTRELREQVLADAETPSGVLRALRGGAELESIHLDARGRWWHEGAVFTNEKLSLLFSRSVYQTEGGVWFLRVGSQSYPITVACTGYFAERLLSERALTQLVLTTGEQVETGLSGWMTDGGERLGVRLADGRDVRLVGAAHQMAVSLVESTEAGWPLLLGQGIGALQAWPEVARGLRLPMEATQG